MTDEPGATLLNNRPPIKPNLQANIRILCMTVSQSRLFLSFPSHLDRRNVMKQVVKVKVERENLICKYNDNNLQLRQQRAISH